MGGEKKGVFKWSFAFASVIMEFMSLMEDGIIVWFVLLITISAAFQMIKSLVSIPPCRCFQMEQLRLYFVEFGSGIIRHWGQWMLSWCWSTWREAVLIDVFWTFPFGCFQAPVCKGKGTQFLSSALGKQLPEVWCCTWIVCWILALLALSQSLMLDLFLFWCTFFSLIRIWNNFQTNKQKTDSQYAWSHCVQLSFQYLHVKIFI